MENKIKVEKEILQANTDLLSINASSDTSISNDVTSKTKTPKYYKQAYRTEWESMPDFQGWLKGVPGQPTRAYCTYCKKSLHAHRLSLLKHTCTLKHTKAAQAVFNLQEQQLQKEAPSQEVLPENLRSATLSAKQAVQPTDHSNEDIVDVSKEPSGSCDEHETSSATPEESQKRPQEETASEPLELVHEGRDDDAPEKTDEANQAPSGVEESEFHGPPKKKYSRPEVTPVPVTPSGPLSTHVLDTAKGNPIAGLRVSLYKLVDGRWTFISEGQTNPDGRYSGFIQKPDFVAGRYKLHFDVDRYFEMRKVETLYPFIEIAFDVKSPNDSYHVPLLLSPFGYTTYRGS